MSSKMKNCKVCNTEIASNAKTCPNCGAKNKKPIYKRPWLYILIVLVLLIGILAFSGSDDTPIDYSKPDFVLTADDIISAYNDNKVAADEKYEGKVLEISGTIASISEYTVRIDAEDEDNWLYDVCVELAEGQDDLLRRLSNDKKLTVVGVCDSTDVFSDVKLDKAKIIEKKSDLSEKVEKAEKADAPADEGKKPTESAEPEELTVDIDTLLEDYESNQVAADDKYKGKKLTVTGGKITDIGDDYVTLTGSDAFAISYLYGYYNSKDDIMQLSEDDKVTVVGICRGEELFGVKITGAIFE